MFTLDNFAVNMWPPRTTVSQDVQTRSSAQLALAKFISKRKRNF